MENPSATNLTLTSNYNAALVLATLRDIRMIASSGEGRKKKKHCQYKVFSKFSEGEPSW